MARRRGLLSNHLVSKWIASSVDSNWIDGYIAGIYINSAEATYRQKTSPFYPVTPGSVYGFAALNVPQNATSWITIGWYRDADLATAISRPATYQRYLEARAPEDAHYMRVSLATYGVVDLIALYSIDDYKPPYTVLNNSVNWLDGYFKNATAINPAHPNGERYTPEYIQIKPNKWYVMSAVFDVEPASYRWYCICTYDDKQQGITRNANNSQLSFQKYTESNAAFARLSLRTYDLNPRIFLIAIDDIK